MVGIKAFAYDCEVDGIYYNRKSATEFEVTFGTNDYYNGSKRYTGDLVIPSSVKYNGKTFSVTSIGKQTFIYSTSLTSITIPNSVTSIGGSAFYRCTSLTSITIPNSVTSIGSNAFADCTSLTSITIPNSVTSIGDSEFGGCRSLTSITIPNSVTSIGGSAFRGCTSLTSITIPNSVTSIGSNAFENCTSLTSITIPNSVTSIDSYAFTRCTSLTSITIPNSVTSIGSNAFENCTSLTSITIPNSVTSIDSYAFTRCTSLTSITIPNSITSIGGAAFIYCTSLTTIVLGKNVKEILGSTFKGCSALTTIYLLAETPPSLYSYDFESNHYLWTDLYVPIGSKDTYQNANNWSNFKSINEFDPASLDADNVTMDVKASTGGQVKVNGTAGTSVAVKKGSGVTISFVADEGYVLKEVKVDDKDVTAMLTNGTYTISNVTENVSISATFVEAPITLTIQHAENGCVRQVVKKDEQLTFQIVAAQGWKVNTVTMDGQDVTNQLSIDGSYTTPAITKNATLSISFESTNVAVRSFAASPIKVYAKGNTLYVTGASDGEPISVYRADGSIATTLIGNGDSIRTLLPTGEVYIVKTQGMTMKISM